MNKLSKVLTKFGFESAEKQLALLENFALAGYFENEKIWQMVNLINRNSKGEKVSAWNVSEEKIFQSIIQTVELSKNDSQQLLKLFEDKIFDEQDAEDIILYLAQNGFGRLEGQERDQISKQALVEKNKVKYLKNAKKLGLILQKNPSDTNYDESWIQGSSGLVVMRKRIKYLKNLSKKCSVGTIRILTGERELNIDSDKLNDVEGQKFIAELAKKNGIKINKNQPLKVIAATKKICINYAKSEERKILEIMMVRQVFLQVFGYEIAAQNLVNSKIPEGKERPDTESCAVDAYKDFKSRIKHQDFGKRRPKILIISNQPYCKRQELSVEAAIEKASGKIDFIDFEGVGVATKISATKINSEFAALIAECFLHKSRRNSTARKRPIEQLLYAKRCKIKFVN